VPLSAGTTRLGALTALGERHSIFVDEDLMLMEVLANQTAVIIETRRLFDAVRDLNADLGRRLAELRTLNDELSSFAYSVSHDLRAPLRSIDGFSQILMEDHADVLGDAGRQHLDRVRGATGRMSALIDDLLNLSRVTREEMRPEPLELGPLAASIVDDLRARHPERAVEFAGDAGVEAEADPRLLRIVLVNLLENAWKFTRERSPAHISLRAEVRDGMAVFCVRDDGAGFDMRYAGKLFGAFQRLHTQQEFEGTGVGLATVQRIVHRHGGQVWAEGEVGRGASFCFTLPLAARAREVTW
jgi:signal transduction histidine kinase